VTRKRNHRESIYTESLIRGEFPEFHLMAEGEIEALLAEGESIGAIAEELGIGEDRVRKVQKRLKLKQTKA
jgi:hypothetical protein